MNRNLSVVVIVSVLVLAGVARAQRPYRYLRYGYPAAYSARGGYVYGSGSTTGFFRFRTSHRSNYDGYSPYGRYGPGRLSNGRPFYYPRKYYGYGYYGSPAYRLPSGSYSRYFPARPPRVRYRIGIARLGPYLPR